ncbi:hypothetical protein BOTCAL_1323g00010 [Botryotinia calthae]|uniref:HNH nuclease domain-containing protein n=1 Tax=Botryotinia calthae TaxID=38488 RepID=A0A4Y8CE77_9HELO|nr:hypothetical protein BOTCAL_1323g00010 [Botryotinia calthae]
MVSTRVSNRSTSTPPSPKIDQYKCHPRSSCYKNKPLMPADSSSATTSSFQTHGSITLRQPATITPSALEKSYKFLSEPLGKRKFVINFRHPAYYHDQNILFALSGWDNPEGGIHYGVAHNACAIFAVNRFDGWLSTSAKVGDGDKIKASWDEVLPAYVKNYYFHVPYNNEQENEDSHNSTQPYRWPIVTNFQDWKFPDTLPDVWKRCEDTQGIGSTTASQSNLSLAIQRRDSSCRITGFQTATEVAHIIPEHEKQWFIRNSMGRFNINQTLDPQNMLRDSSNAVLLRSDIHFAFGQRKLVFFPKFPEEDNKRDANQQFVVHMLEPTPDISQLYHNTVSKIPECRLEFLFVRFAWSIFPYLTNFLSREVENRLVVKVDATGTRTVDHAMDPIKMENIIKASRTNNSAKRSRIASQLDGVEDGQVDGERENEELKRSKRRRISPTHNMIRGFSPSSYAHTRSTVQDHNDSAADVPFDDLPLCRPTIMNSSPLGSTILTPKDEESKNEEEMIRTLRKEALVKQRPLGWSKPNIPKYSRHRPAVEELELMGVEILEDEDLEEMDE